MSSAYEQGMRAFWDDVTENPYNHETKEYLDWEEGRESAYYEWYGDNQYVGVDFDD